MLRGPKRPERTGWRVDCTSTTLRTPGQSCSTGAMALQVMADHAAPRLDAAVALSVSLCSCQVRPSARAGLLQQALHRLGQRGLVVLDPDDVARPSSTSRCTIAFWQPIASIVTVAPRRSSPASSSGIAVISLLLACVRICPSVTPLPQCQAVTRCSAPSAVREPRSVLPSMAMCSCARLGRSAPSSLRKQASKRTESSIANTRLNVSCEAMPRSKGRKRRSHSSLNSPHSAHVDPVLGAGRHRAQRRQQQFLQRVLEAPGLPARIVQVFKALHQLVAWGGRRVVWHRVVGWRGRAGLLPLNRGLG